MGVDLRSDLQASFVPVLLHVNQYILPAIPWLPSFVPVVLSANTSCYSLAPYICPCFIAN